MNSGAMIDAYYDIVLDVETAAMIVQAGEVLETPESLNNSLGSPFPCLDITQLLDPPIRVLL